MKRKIYIKGNKILKNTLKVFFIVSILLSGSHETLFASKPSGSSNAYFVDPALPMYQMSEMQKNIIAQLKLWDRTYNRCVNEKISLPDIWLYMAEEVFGGYVSISDVLKGYVTTTYKGDPQSDAPFILRGMLASGVSSLFAAQAFMEQGPAKKIQALKAYERGLNVLEKVIQIGKINPDIAYIPNFSTALRTSAQKDRFFMHPLAGCETILTGVSDLPLIFTTQGLFTRKLVTNTELQSMFAGPFLPLEKYQTLIRSWYQNCTEKTLSDARAKHFKQGSTIETARFFLSEFCPWGLGIYLTLKDAGLTKNLDWRILRPFAGKEPIAMSEIVIKKSKLPAHIIKELNQVIGDGRSGFLDSAKKKPVKWSWVSRPATYTVKYISPLVYERTKTTEYFSKAMGYVTWVFGGPVDYFVDKALGGLLKEVGHYYGKDSGIYNASWVLVQGNDKGLLTTDFVTKGELPGITLILKKTAGAAFEALEQQMIDDMYEGIDPSRVAIGTSYNGKPIPPVMMRGDVLGFQKVPMTEYNRTIQAVRHYVLVPAAITRKNPAFPYDLSKNEGLGTLRKDAYLKEQASQNSKKEETVRKNACTLWRTGLY